MVIQVALNEKLIEISNNKDMNQMVNEPTRGQNILDLLMTTNPGLVSNIEVHPGMSDHQVVIANIDMKAKTSKRNPDCLLKNKDMESVNLDMEDIFEEEAADDDFPSVGPLPDLPDGEEGTAEGEDEDNTDVMSKLKDLSKGAARKVSLILQFDIQISNSIPQTIYQSQDHTKNHQYSTDILITGRTGNTLKIYKSSTDILSSQEPTSKTTLATAYHRQYTSHRTILLLKYGISQILDHRKYTYKITGTPQIFITGRTSKTLNIYKFFHRHFLSQDNLQNTTANHYSNS
ncbi:unnamed protein product [Mytilus edulis]|uniref:Uncharacterized protein n=1 Tax=Mytilus edulis TaxID=6550 RepID=A0A8S3SL36_MYTED|nr:unnamed protein product [Mytilus edulis]